MPQILPGESTAQIGDTIVHSRSGRELGVVINAGNTTLRYRNELGMEGLATRWEVRVTKRVT